MRWSERQRAMLAAMGVRLWEREPVVTVAEAVEVGIEEPVVTAPVSPSRRGVVAIELPAADWLFVGEPLGAETEGGQAQLLDNMLRAIGVRRDAPGRVGMAAFFALDDKPGAGDEAGRHARVQSAVETVRPRCVVALGRHAAQVMFNSDEPLGALRGRVHVGFGVPVVVTCSLAFLLRHGEEKARAWADLCLAVRTVEDGAG